MIVCLPHPPRAATHVHFHATRATGCETESSDARRVRNVTPAAVVMSRASGATAEEPLPPTPPLAPTPTPADGAQSEGSGCQKNSTHRRHLRAFLHLAAGIARQGETLGGITCTQLIVNFTFYTSIISVVMQCLSCPSQVPGPRLLRLKTSSSADSHAARALRASANLPKKCGKQQYS